MMELVFKFIKFGFVGLLGMGVDFSVTWFCKEKLRWNKFVANSFGFIVAASSNYIFNRVWTFQSENPQIAGEYASFILISVIGLALNNGIIYLLNEKFKINFYVAKVGAIAVVTIWNFSANYIFTFRQL